MASQIQNNFRARKSFAKIGKIIDIPNLIDIQKQSYEKFLQKDVPRRSGRTWAAGRFQERLPHQGFFRDVSIEFVSYTLDKPKYDVDECRQRGMTFAAPIKVTVRLVVWDTNEETGSQSIRDVKEQEVFFGEIPLMTDNGTFIINGTGARGGDASCTAAPASSTTTTRARRTPRASSSTAPASSPTAAPGSTSSSTPRTCVRED
jgi:DNA-directed RNA polymerase subunit beta